MRSDKDQVEIDRQTRSLVLYHFQACPFCVIVRRNIQRLGLNIEMRDVKRDKKYDQELVAGGGQFQVPCLRIENEGKFEWMYESADINEYLTKRFG